MQEIFIAVVLGVLAVLLLNPAELWMPDEFVMMAVAGLLVVFAAYAGFVWKEMGGDEREDLHRLFAGRVGFLVGAGVLVLGIGVQSFSHKVDPWLVVALVVMIAAKIGGIIYSRARK